MLKAAVLTLTAAIACQAVDAQSDSLARGGADSQSTQRALAVRVARPDSAQPTMPLDVHDYQRVYSAPLLVDGVPGTLYQYARDHDRVNVLVTAYDPAAALHTSSDTVNLVRDDYTTAFDTLCTVAQRLNAYVG